MPNSYTPHAIVERAQLLYAIVKRLKINIGQLIYDQMLQVIKTSKGLWLPTLIAKLYYNARVKKDKEEEGI